LNVANLETVLATDRSPTLSKLKDKFLQIEVMFNILWLTDNIAKSEREWQRRAFYVHRIAYCKIKLNKNVIRVLEVSISILICALHQTRYHKRKFVSGLNDFDLSSLDELYTIHSRLILPHESADGW